MGVNIHKLIAAISPDVYCDSSVRKEVKKIVKDGLAKGNDKAYLEAAKKAKPYESEIIFFYDEAKKEPLAGWGLKSPSEEHKLTYNSVSESLEPLYFWLLDFMDNMFPGNVEKITDNFVSSPGSSHFSELSGKATRMQEEAMKMLGAANQVLKSVLNLIYDLKEMKLLLRTYDDYHSRDSTLRGSARLSLKQRWMDMVDFAKRGTTSLKQLAAQMDYVTIIDAFMVANSLKDVKDLDLNDRVKRILNQRVQDFLTWVEESEKQLRQRYKIEVNYLRSQVGTLKLYSRWIKPYLKAARKLEQNAESNAGLITTFNTILLELSIMGKASYSPKKDVDVGLLPETFEKVNSRAYQSLVIVEFKFRGIPQKISQRGEWSFGGNTDMYFKSYSLNEQELSVLKDQMEKDDLGDVMHLIEGITTESLEELQEDINEFLEEGSKDKKEEKTRMKEGDVNPFTSLFSFLKTSRNRKQKEWDLKQEIDPDSVYEKVIRSQAIIDARESCFTVFDVYKRAHGMPAHPDPYLPLQ